MERPDRRDEFDEAYADGVDGDRLAELVLDAEAYFLAAAKPAGDDERQAVTDSVMDELTKLVGGISSYRPERQPMRLYLAMVAKRKLSNHRRDQGRRARREPVKVEADLGVSVAELADAGNGPVEADDAAGTRLDDLLERAVGVLPPRDLAFLRAMRCGADDAGLLAVLGDDDSKAVKRNKDRIIKTIKRKVLP